MQNVQHQANITDVGYKSISSRSFRERPQPVEEFLFVYI